MGSGASVRSTARNSLASRSWPPSSSSVMRRASATVAPPLWSSRKRSSACWANSSTISASRAGARFKPASCRRIGSFQSGIFDSGDSVDGLHEGLPALPLGSQDFPSLRGQPVIAPPALAALLHPSALNPAALLQAIQQRVERCRVKTERALRSLFDQLADLVAMAG